MNPIYTQTVPLLTRHLKALHGILAKAQTYAAERKFDESVLVNARLAPDMHALARQIQIAGDFAKGACARLSTVENPKYDDHEKTLAELGARIEKTLAFIALIDPAKFDGCENREISLTLGGHAYLGLGADYVRDIVLPHFYFHTCTAYAILRHQGVQIGKLDYLGA
jgi:uncharacterized protein